MLTPPSNEAPVHGWQRRNLVCQSIGLALLLVNSLFANGADNLPDFTNLSLEELSAVKVTSVSKKEQKLSRVAAAVYVMTQDTAAA